MRYIKSNEIENKQNRAEQLTRHDSIAQTPAVKNKQTNKQNKNKTTSMVNKILRWDYTTCFGNFILYYNF